jgi:hypothetical protein
VLLPRVNEESAYSHRHHRRPAGYGRGPRRRARAAIGLSAADKLEIILARGKQPSVQRNAALRAAAGEIIYFLDDDSIALPENLRRGVAQFASADVKMVGGPSLCPPDAPNWSRRLP